MTAHVLDKECQRRRKQAEGDDLFAPLQRIRRLFRCDPCLNQFFVEQPVVRPIQTLCPKCGRPV